MERNFILDPDFSQGAQLYAPEKPMTFTGNIDFMSGKENLKPCWLLTQWNSKNDIRTVAPVRMDDEIVYENEYKKVALSDEGVLTLGVNGTVEYDKPRKVKRDPWVHLYMEQRYAEPYPLDGIEKMKLRFSYSIPYFKDGTPAGELDPAVHASIAVFYVILMDNNPESPAYQQFINFGLMLYDNRTAITPESWFMDTGQNPIDATNMMIYVMDSSVYSDPIYADGKWRHVDFDPLPYFKKAFDIVQEAGSMQGSRFEDLAISSAFFGFEVSGVMDNEMKIRDIFLGTEPSK